MPAEIRVPQLGESVVEATIARWIKHEGEAVTEGEAVAELETEKVNIEVPAEAAGVLRQVLHGEGETVKVGDPIAILDQDTAGGTAAQTIDGAAAPPAPPPTTGAPVRSPAASVAPAASGAGAADGTHLVSPVAQRLASEHGIDADRVQGSGPGGRVMKEDVLERIGEGAGRVAEATATYAPQPPAQPTAPAPSPQPAAVPRPVPPPPATALATAGSTAPFTSVAAPPPAPAAPGPDAARGEERIRLSRRRLTIARRLVDAQHTAAMLTTFNEVDLSAVMDVRKRRRDAFKERHGVSLGFMSFFARAALGALKAFPNVNAELQGDDLVLKRYYDLGIAVSTDEGLVVPVVRDADRLSFAEIERQIAALATKARDRRLTLEDLRGGTFTITNGGVFGSLLSTPILNPPQVAILGMHKIQERPVAIGGQVVIRPMMYVALTYDHRVVDGKEAVSFLVRIKELVEDPESLLLEG